MSHRKAIKNVSRFQDTVNNSVGSPYKTLNSQYINEERIMNAYLNASKQKQHLNTVKKIYCKGKTLGNERSPKAGGKKGA